MDGGLRMRWLGRHDLVGLVGLNEVLVSIYVECASFPSSFLLATMEL
jgi:hypothetical protein